MFGKKNVARAAEEKKPADLEMTDLVKMGLVDEDVASSLKEYLGHDPLVEQPIAVAVPEKATPSAPVAETAPTPEASPTPVVDKTPTEGHEATPAPVVDKTPTEGHEATPQINLSEELAQPLAASLRENDHLEVQLRQAQEQVTDLQKQLAELRHSDVAAQREELAELLIEARLRSKAEVKAAEQQAQEIIAAAQAKAEVMIQEATYRQESLRSQYQHEEQLLKAKFMQMQDYFAALKNNSDLLFDDYLNKSQQIIQALDNE